MAERCRIRSWFDFEVYTQDDVLHESVFSSHSCWTACQSWRSANAHSPMSAFRNCAFCLELKIILYRIILCGIIYYMGGVTSCLALLTATTNLLSSKKNTLLPARHWLSCMAGGV